MTRLGVALIVAVVLGAGILYLQRQAAPAGSARAPVTAIVNAPDGARIDPAPYLAAFPLTPPSIAPVTGTTPVDRALEKALAPMRKGDYAAAATTLDGLLLDHPGEPRAQLYLGVARLYLDEPTNALELLRTLPSTAAPEIQGQAAWYALVGIARLRDPSHVEAEADALCTSSLPTAPRACDALEALTRARRNPPARP